MGHPLSCPKATVSKVVIQESLFPLEIWTPVSLKIIALTFHRPETLLISQRAESFTWRSGPGP